MQAERDHRVVTQVPPLRPHDLKSAYFAVEANLDHYSLASAIDLVHWARLQRLSAAALYRTVDLSRRGHLTAGLTSLGRDRSCRCSSSRDALV